MMTEQRGLFSMGSNFKCGSHYFFVKDHYKNKRGGWAEADFDLDCY